MTLKNAGGLAAWLLFAACGGAVATNGNDVDGGASGSGGAGGSEGASTASGGSGSSSASTGGVAGSVTFTPGSPGSFGDMRGDGAAGGPPVIVDAGRDLGLCTGPGQCAAVVISCCGACGGEPASSFAAINANERDNFYNAQCPNPQPCPALDCIGWPPHVGARCTAGHCELFDIEVDPAYTQCETVADCMIRSGLECCSCGQEVGLSNAGASKVEAEVCDPRMSCRSCPTSTRAMCADHVCKTSNFIL